MKIPLYLINEADGTPIPDSDYGLDVQKEHFHLFQTVRNETLPDKPTQVILGIVSHNQPWELFEDRAQLAASAFRIGILCSVESIEDLDEFYFIKLQTHKRVYINSIEAGEDINKPLLVTVDLEPVQEDFLPSEEEMIDDIKNLVTIVTDNPNVFEPLLIKDLNQTNFIINQMNILAHYMLRDESQRLRYLQSDNQIERFNLIVTKVKEHVDTTNSITDNNGNRRKRSIVSRPPRKRTETSTVSIQQRFINSPLPPKVRQSLRREVDKLETLSSTSTEHSQLVDYLTWVLDIPWGVQSYKDYELIKLVTRLDDTHYGLKDVKEHVLEHMTIEKIRGGSSGAVLCFVGPPGTGKTSIAKEIAHVTGRSLQRLALGGLSDEAEIRG